MKHYISIEDGSVHGFDEGVDVNTFIDLNHFRIMTDTEVDMHYFPEKYYTAEEAAEVAREWMPTLSPIEFDIKLNNAGLYDAVQELIKDNFELRIAYNRATFFSRTALFIDQARIALGLTDEQVDEMWLS